MHGLRVHGIHCMHPYFRLNIMRYPFSEISGCQRNNTMFIKNVVYPRVKIYPPIECENKYHNVQTIEYTEKISTKCNYLQNVN